MRRPIYKKKFEKDFKGVVRRGYHIEKLRSIADALIKGEMLDRKYLNHALTGQYADCRECHIEPDWLLIYLIEGDDIIFLRTGTHADLFR